MTYGGPHHQHSQGAAPPGFGPPIPVPGHAYGMPQPPAAPPPADGPEFIAHDRHNSVIVDSSGVSLEINGRTLEFPWAVIATVHFAPAPSGAVLMVAVAHRGGMLYECRVVARRKEMLPQWLGELGPVLHHYLAYRPPAHG
ncbi:MULTISPECIES: hypothetical protein [unclassified Streptomyces]|uniref:hypothetical protein n=1 Tax=unclassified Streptomyces TaxID=2593676 RepID=UPI00365B19B2